MSGREEVEKFMNSRLIAYRKEEGKTRQLSHSTINTMGLAMVELLKYVMFAYKDIPVREAAMRAMQSVKNVIKTSGHFSHKLAARKGFTEKENYLVPIAELKKFLESKAHKNTLKHALDTISVKGSTKRRHHAIQFYTRKELFELQCHVALLLTLHTGKRPGVLCGIKCSDVNKTNKELKRFVAEKDRDLIDPETGAAPCSFQFPVTPSCEVAVFKTVSVSYINVSLKMLQLLAILAYIRKVVDRCSDSARLFTSVEKHPLMEINTLLKKAWTDAGCNLPFTSTMMRHTIVTRARDPEKNLTVDELKTLALGMDHSVRTAEKVYYHGKEKRMLNNSKIIENVLHLNGHLKEWGEEVEQGLAEDVEEDAISGVSNLIENEVEDDNDDKDDEPQKKMIGNRERIYSTYQSDLIERMFQKYIDEKTVNERESVKNIEMEEIYRKNMEGQPADSPFAELLRFGCRMICNKVRSLITTARRRKEAAMKKEESLRSGRLVTPKGKKSTPKGKKSTPKDNPKL